MKRVRVRKATSADVSIGAPLHMRLRALTPEKAHTAPRLHPGNQTAGPAAFRVSLPPDPLCSPNDLTSNRVQLSYGRQAKIRVALGAQQRDILRVVLNKGRQTLACSIGVGAVLGRCINIETRTFTKGAPLNTIGIT